MTTPDSKTSLKKRLLILLIISVIIIVVASYFLSQEVETLKTYLNKIFNPQVSNLIIIAFPFTIGYVLSFIPEIFGEYIKEIIFGKDVPEIEQKPIETPPQVIINNIIPEQNQSPKAVVAEIPTKIEPHNGKFYPNKFLPNLKYFVGRVDLLKNVEAELKTSHRVSIHDISGLGKTFSTLKYADLHQHKYDKLFFINASKDAYLESLANCGELLEPSVKSAKEQLVKVNAFKNWLENNNNWLVIFDNVDIASDIKPFVPANLNGDCLFTSNFKDICRFTTEVKITKLDDIDSKILLYSISNAVPLQKPNIFDQKEVAAFDKIIVEIDGLPISLTTTGAFIFKKGISFAEYLERLEVEPEITLKAEDELEVYPKKSALKAFSIAFEENTDTTTDDLQQKLYAEAVRMLYFAASFLAPDDIHEEFLRKFLETYFEPFKTSKTKAVFWQDVRAKFTEYDLFKRNDTGEPFQTHRLIQKTIQTKLNADEKKTICGQVLEILKDYFPKYDYNNKELCEKYYEHTISALENADKLIESEDSKTLYYRIGSYQQDSGNYEQAEYYYQRNLEISKKVYGKKHQETATSLNNLALVYESQSKYDEAIKLYLEAIEIDKKTIGIEHPDYAIHLNNLALVYKAQGKYDEAIKLYLEAIEIDKKTIGIEHPEYATRLNNLARVYDSQGKYNKAIKLYLEAIEIDKKTIGIEHPNYAIRLNNLANVYYAQGKYQDALLLFEEVLRIFEAKLPKTHHYIQEVKDDLMNCKQKLNLNS
jgi:tetratricopeptide (TPR) repeat protein